MRKWSAAVREWLGRRHSLIGRIFFETVIVFIGVTAAFGLEAMRRQSEEETYRRSMIAALAPTLDDLVAHNEAFRREVSGKLATFDAAIARHQQPPIPVYRERDSERPPVRAWDGVVSTGAAKALEPRLFFSLSLFYTRQESYGERYLRYNDFTEQRVFTLGADHSAAYDPASGRLKPEFAAHVDRLRDLLVVNQSLTAQARELKAALVALR